ncbi:hypothetical protein IU438_19075 [Nocardia cyriacigeorgica]|uniref:hypothetical protein n=1 Tax=Nocardia cyriacigeorgica TaxID=135487 RepID=UPI0018949DCF|nr:hypothetical protein [Nocardia cyriacigeorgica]MBF6397897.1 hypothetical protein [Nocardia cyriacigeorgica]MBF6402446.1 hypothetical protein [Nocardia cyriacigeorgica]
MSFLEGKTLTEQQAVVALRAAEAAEQITELARKIGLTALELVGMAAADGLAATHRPGGR